MDPTPEEADAVRILGTFGNLSQVNKYVGVINWLPEKFATIYSRGNRKIEITPKDLGEAVKGVVEALYGLSAESRFKEVFSVYRRIWESFHEEEPEKGKNFLILVMPEYYSGEGRFPYRQLTDGRIKPKTGKEAILLLGGRELEEIKVIEGYRGPEKWYLALGYILPTERVVVSGYTTSGEEIAKALLRPTSAILEI